MRCNYYCLQILLMAPWWQKKQVNLGPKTLHSRRDAWRGLLVRRNLGASSRLPCQASWDTKSNPTQAQNATCMQCQNRTLHSCLGENSFLIRHSKVTRLLNLLKFTSYQKLKSHQCDGHVIDSNYLHVITHFLRFSKAVAAICTIYACKRLLKIR